MLLLLLLLSPALSFSQSAELSFYNSEGKITYVTLPYYLKPERVQYGVKFGVNTFNILLRECKPVLDDSLEEYFAAYVSLGRECAPEEVLNELIAHGADFVFLDVRDSSKVGSGVASNRYDVPVFFIDGRTGADPFSLGSTKKKFVTISFLMPEGGGKGNAVKLQFFYEPAYEYSKKFIEVLEKVYFTLRDRVVFEPVVVTFSSKAEEFVRGHCVSQGNYCALEPGLKGTATGRDVVLEAIRQKCVYKAGVKEYFSYMDGFYSKCVHEFTEKCSLDLARGNSLYPEDIKKCVTDSFSKTSSDVYQNENELLREERDKYKRLGVERFPEIYINSMLYKGSLSYFDLLLSLCSALHEESKDCRNLSLEGDSEVNLIVLVAVSLSVFAVGVAVLAFVCRKIARKRYLMELNRSVDRYVTEYARVKEDTSRTN